MDTWPFRKVVLKAAKKKHKDIVDLVCLCDPDSCGYKTHYFSTLIKHLKKHHTFVL